MSLSQEEQFNEEWRGLFENAEESPSEELWDSIVRRLDEEESEPILPLWPRVRPWVYGVAATFITLLVGWWATRSIEDAGFNRPVAGQTQTENLAGKTGSADNRKPATATGEPTGVKAETGGNATENLAANGRRTSEKTKPETPEDSELEQSETATTIDHLIKDQSALALNRKAPRASAPPAQRPSLATDRIAQLDRTSRKTALKNRVEKSEPLALTTRSDQQQPTRETEPAIQPADSRLAYEASYIKNRIVATKKPAPISRIVWYRAPEIAIEPQEKGRAKKEYWAAVTATPMSFNPMTSIHSNLNQAYLAYNAVQQASRLPNTPSLQNQSQISMAWQASSGVKFSKHWSVEAGLQYLNGRSQARNNASVMNSFTNQTENMLVNAIRNSSPTVAKDAIPQAGNSLLPSGLDKNNMSNSSYLTVIPSDQLVSNNFQYLQLPVQLGYHILPEHKISYSVLGGLMANVFLKNTINGSLEVNAGDQVYRPLAMAGTAGLRINYHPTHHWSGSLTGSYQQSLQSGTQSDTQLQVRPQALGVGFGLNYHF
ncbi:hypothetical protein ACFPMF_16555 [Larkinella bovis]|uniref:Outer membrane protein beta-barrel domain-containing protein n=1 Tax=Larkinella bovis TaxID=683041 RepID=A0ABW0IDY4_9BACT